VAQQSPEPAQGAADRGNWVWIPETTESGWLLAELLAEFRRHRLRLAIVFAGVAVLAFVATFAFPVQYQSSAVLAPVSTTPASSLGAIASQLSGLAGLTGIKAPDAAGDRTIVTIATMQSRGFRGEVYVLPDFRARTADWCWLAGFVSLAAGALWWGR